MPVLKPSFVRYFAPFEKFVHCLKRCSIRPDADFDEVINLIYNKVCSIYYDFKNSKVSSPIFDRSDLLLLENLGKRKDIVVCPPDKGRGVVIINKQDYVLKNDNNYQ